MATVNFSVPDHIKEAFNKAFEGENKSAILSQLMLKAVEERNQTNRRKAVVEEIFRLRRGAGTFTDEEIHQARIKGRP